MSSFSSNFIVDLVQLISRVPQSGSVDVVDIVTSVIFPTSRIG